MKIKHGINIKTGKRVEHIQVKETNSWEIYLLVIREMQIKSVISLTYKNHRILKKKKKGRAGGSYGQFQMLTKTQRNCNSYIFMVGEQMLPLPWKFLVS